MPSPIIFGVLAFLLNYVPYLGALAGIVVSMGVALVSFDGPGWCSSSWVLFISAWHRPMLVRNWRHRGVARAVFADLEPASMGNGARTIVAI
jgi:hypothetical protein